MNQQFGNRHRHKGYLLKSNAEYSFALMLDLLQKAGEIVEWLYEPKSFVFDDIQFGTRQYRPDFWVKWRGGEELYYEVKSGYIAQKDITKWRRLSQRYPSVKLVLAVPKIPRQGKFKNKVDAGKKYLDHIWEVNVDYKKLGIKI